MKSESERATLAFLMGKISGCSHFATVSWPMLFTIAEPPKVAAHYDLNESMARN